MAVTLGTNSGFVTVSPTADPTSGLTATIDDRAIVTKDTSPSTARVITEVGWWDATAGTEEANFEVGLYAANGAVVPGEAGTLLQVSRTNAKGTAGGWHKVTGLNWPISPSTAYWIGVQLDNTATTTTLDYIFPGGPGYDSLAAGQTTLPNPFGGGALAQAAGLAAIYALWKSNSNFLMFMGPQPQQ